MSYELNTLDGPIDVIRQNEINLLMDMAGTLAEFEDDTEAADDRRRLLEVAQDLREMFFLVVIIGEFNAGKSSFVNALLGEELLPMGITPTTEAIELVRYNETPRRTPVLRGESLREWAHPNTGAPGVAIVDTPGTGSIFQKHETTAKSFLHRSDLVIFLISAKRAFAETERLYLETAKAFGKKVILVVNQVDLLEESERATVRRFIEQQVKELLDLEPLIFMVSAKEALTAIKKDEQAQTGGGIEAVRAHLRGVFTDVSPSKQKLLVQLDLAGNIARKYHNRVLDQNNMITADANSVKAIQNELQSQSSGIDASLKEARTQIDKVFFGIRDRGIRFIDDNLSIRMFGRAPSKEQLQAEFQEVVIGRALRDISEATNDYVNAVVDHSRLYWRSVIDRLNKLQKVLDEEFSGLDAGVYSQQRESLQEAIRIAEAELKNYSGGAVMADIQGTFEENLNGFKNSFFATAGGLIAIIIAIATPGPLVGVGAAPFALPALLVAAPFAAIGGVAALRYYRRVTVEVKDEFRKRVDRLEKTYHEALDDLTRKERDRLTQYGTRVLTPIFSKLDALSERYNQQLEVTQRYKERVETLRDSLMEQ